MVLQFDKGKRKMRYVAYYRVSTKRQGRSGLGLEAQRESVISYARDLVGEYTEVESGRKNDRPELAKALKHCRATGAMLVVARLDRLGRDAAFLSSLMDSSVDFVAVDFPEANRLTMHILAAVADYEARLVSERTKVALKQAQARGTRLGNPNGAEALRRANKGNSDAVAAIQRKAQNRAEVLTDMVADIREGGITSLSGIARELNHRGAKTPRGGQWHPASVQRLLGRLEIPTRQVGGLVNPVYTGV